jgi:hypothetical protein
MTEAARGKPRTKKPQFTVTMTRVHQGCTKKLTCSSSKPVVPPAHFANGWRFAGAVAD